MMHELTNAHTESLIGVGSIRYLTTELSSWWFNTTGSIQEHLSIVSSVSIKHCGWSSPLHKCSIWLVPLPKSRILTQAAMNIVGDALRSTIGIVRTLAKISDVDVAVIIDVYISQCKVNTWRM